MMTGVEFDFVVRDCLEALHVYEAIFEVERIEVTDLPRDRKQNEVVFSIYGTRFHMLDANSEYMLYAPDSAVTPSFWFNVVVKDGTETYGKAMAAGCTEIQPLTEMPDCGVSNGMFADPFGYLWMIHQIHREVGLKERMQNWEKREAEVS